MVQKSGTYLKFFDYALEDYEESWQLWSELGQILIRKQDFSEAASAFQNATNSGPGEFWPWLYLGHAQRELGDFQAAIEATENARNVEIGETELNLVYYHLARYCALLDRKEEAMDYLKTALQKDNSLREMAREDEDLDSLRNEPGFEFPDIDIDPFTNESIIRQIEQGRTYTMERQLKLEATLFGREQKWSWHLGLDANAARDPVGDEFQWFTLSGGFDTGSRWFPNVRLGYRQNLAGTEKAYASLGMTMFKYVNVDIASALNTTKIDGRKLPEGLMFSLGFEVSW